MFPERSTIFSGEIRSDVRRKLQNASTGWDRRMSRNKWTPRNHLFRGCGSGSGAVCWRGRDGQSCFGQVRMHTLCLAGPRHHAVRLPPHPTYINKMCQQKYLHIFFVGVVGEVVGNLPLQPRGFHSILRRVSAFQPNACWALWKGWL